MTDYPHIRVGLSKRLRFEVFKRDGFRCMYCGASPEVAILHCDHINPVALGGTNDIDNLVTACAPCNLGKSAVPLDVVPTSLEDRALETLEREEQIGFYQSIMRAKRERIEDNAQDLLEALCESYRRDSIPSKNFDSLKVFAKRLPLDQCLDAIDIAKRKFPYSYRQGFLYFCGICWKRIRTMEGE